jgi:hypothetical protein
VHHPIPPGRLATSRDESYPWSTPPLHHAARGCRFIIGDPKDFHVLGEAIYCAAPVERVGEPWCAAHRRICYNGPQAGSLPTMHHTAQG